MVKLIAQVQKIVPITKNETNDDDDDDDDVNDASDFDSFLYDELWDVDTDLIVHQEDEQQVLIMYGYITALRKVAEAVFDYDKETLNSLSPNYVALEKSIQK